MPSRACCISRHKTILTMLLKQKAQTQYFLKQNWSRTEETASLKGTDALGLWNGILWSTSWFSRGSSKDPGTKRKASHMGPYPWPTPLAKLRGSYISEDSGWNVLSCRQHQHRSLNKHQRSAAGVAGKGRLSRTWFSVQYHQTCSPWDLGFIHFYPWWVWWDATMMLWALLELPCTRN